MSMSGSEQKKNQAERITAADVMNAMGGLEGSLLEEAQELRSGRELAGRRGRILKMTRVGAGIAAAALLFLVVGVAVPRLLSPWKNSSSTAPASDFAGAAPQAFSDAEEAAEAPAEEAAGAAEENAMKADLGIRDAESPAEAEYALPACEAENAAEPSESPAQFAAPQTSGVTDGASAEPRSEGEGEIPMMLLRTADGSAEYTILFAGGEWSLPADGGEWMTTAIDTAGMRSMLKSMMEPDSEAGIVPAGTELYLAPRGADLPDAAALLGWPAEDVLGGSWKESAPTVQIRVEEGKLPPLEEGMVYKLVALWEDSFREMRDYCGSLNYLILAK
ncbi:MAG: hypothetical protein K6E92_04380 [Lachnospiraceae bacterium]|nr:hypothetical protein [Lachnospiraceae bacterium]